jgi:prenyltransferase beta subunit
VARARDIQKTSGKGCTMKKAFYALILSLLLVPSLVLGADTLPKALDYIVSMQEPNGAWSRLKGEFPPETEPTSWAVKVFAMNGLEKERVEKGTAFILKVQKPSGGFSMVPAAPEDPEVTAYAIMGLDKIPGKKDAVVKAADYLAKVQLPDGAYVSDSPQQFDKKAKKNTQTTCFVAWALSEAK